MGVAQDVISVLTHFFFFFLTKKETYTLGLCILIISLIYCSAAAGDGLRGMRLVRVMGVIVTRLR